MGVRQVTAIETRNQQSSQQTRLSMPLLLLAVGAVYFVLAKLGLQLAVDHPIASPVWPVTGFAIAATLVLGSAVWPAILAAAFLANLTASGVPFASFFIAFGNTLEAAIAGVLVMRYSGGADTFDRPSRIAS